MSAIDSETGLDFDPETNTKERTFARFSREAVKNNFKSEQEGKSVFEDKEFVTIVVPGNRGAVAFEEVTADHKARWPKSYAAFKEGLEAPVNGMPIEMWPVLGPSQVLEFKAMNIRTVEDVAGLGDDGIARIGMGGRELRDKAQAWLASATGNAALSKAIADSEAKDAEIANLKGQVGSLVERLDKLEKARGDK